MRTLWLLFVLMTFAQPITATSCPDTNTPPNRGDCRQ